MLIDHSDTWAEFQDAYFLILLAFDVLWIPTSILVASAASILKWRRLLPLPLLLTGYWCSLTGLLAAWEGAPIVALTYRSVAWSSE